jgi:Domain of unknown function (DUF4252)
MKNFTHNSLGVALLVALMQIGVQAANPAGYVDFGKLSPGDSGSQFVEVNVNSNLIAMVGRLAQKAEPDVADLLQGLHSIRVNVIGLNDDNRADIETRIKAIRTQLDSQGWERIVAAQQKNEDVEVYLKTRGPDAVEGVVVMVLDGRKQAVLVNVVGDIKPEKLGMLGEKFNIDPLKKLGPAVNKKAEKE